MTRPGPVRAAGRGAGGLPGCPPGAGRGTRASSPGPSCARCTSGSWPARASPPAARRGHGEGSAPAAAAAPAVPRQLPAAPGHFTGRQAELDVARRLVAGGRAGRQAGTVVISAIDGMAGIGKTALAVHAAHRLAGRFPDGQLFIDLHGYTQGHAAAQRGRGAGVAAARPGRARGADPGGRRGGRRALPPAPGRHQDPDRAGQRGRRGPGAPAAARRPARAWCWSPAAGGSRAWTTRTACRWTCCRRRTRSRCCARWPDPAASRPTIRCAGEIAELCGHLPLALRIAGALLRHRPAWSLEHLAGLLRDQHRRVSALSDGERDLARGVRPVLPEPERDRHRLLFRRLGLVPGPDLDAYAAAALAEHRPGTAAGLLEDLVDHNLLIALRPGPLPAARPDPRPRPHPGRHRPRRRARGRPGPAAALLRAHRAERLGPHRALPPARTRRPGPRPHPRPARPGSRPRLAARRTRQPGGRPHPRPHPRPRRARARPGRAAGWPAPLRRARS